MVLSFCRLWTSISFLPVCDATEGSAKTPPLHHYADFVLPWHIPDFLHRQLDFEERSSTHYADTISSCSITDDEEDDNVFLDDL